MQITKKDIIKEHKYKKIKIQFKSAYKEEEEYFFIDKIFEYIIYPNKKSGYHRKFSTKQEKSFHSLHCIEYKEYGLKLRGRRSSNNLADPWDDYPSYHHKQAKSWKHNSKRKNQYYK
jgi:hypothetical protein